MANHHFGARGQNRVDSIARIWAKGDCCLRKRREVRGSGVRRRGGRRDLWKSRFRRLPGRRRNRVSSGVTYPQVPGPGRVVPVIVEGR
ncbi:hypothetical protein DAD186_11330 [Dermabacter vaginalis]|uniref:Uncharacterized protein n=1 Tax=Dermabacter vaginalis TaxID=1630135 RepID=A0A1B0ZIC5_9MICO|nr:hypothetical protein DAD186_11330 [Dermabacter vaginalis]